MSKVHVDIGILNQYKDHLEWINSLDLKDIVFVERGEPIRMVEGALEEFKYVGLNNVDFIRYGYHLPNTKLVPGDKCPKNKNIVPGSDRCIDECEFYRYHVTHGNSEKVMELCCQHIDAVSSKTTTDENTSEE